MCNARMSPNTISFLCRMKLSCYFNVFTLYFDDNNTKTYRSSYISNINKTCQMYEHTSICLICVDKCIYLLKQQQRHKFNLIPRKNTFVQLRKLYQLNNKQNYICLDLFLSLNDQYHCDI